MKSIIERIRSAFRKQKRNIIIGINALNLVVIVTSCSLTGCSQTAKVETEAFQTTAVLPEKIYNEPIETSTETSTETATEMPTEKTGEEATTLNLTAETVDIQIPGMENSYTFIYLSDLHIVVENSQINDDCVDTVKERYKSFVNNDGITAAEQWQLLPDIVNEFDSDAVLFGGDMIDYASDSNIECLRNGLSKITRDYIYVRADHDYASWYNDLEEEYVKKLHETVDPEKEVFLLEYSDLCIVGINNSTSQITNTALTELQRIFSIGKPIILLTHVPINSLVDNTLEEKSYSAWGNRNLSWGKDAIIFRMIIPKFFWK